MITSAPSAGAGNLSKEIERMIKDITESKMNWRQIPATDSRAQLEMILSNLHVRVGTLVLFSSCMNFENTIDSCIAIDMSGPTSNEQAQVFLSEVKGIMEQYSKTCKLRFGVLIQKFIMNKI